MIFGLDKIKIFFFNIFSINLKYSISENRFYMKGFFGILKISWTFAKFLDLNYLKDKLYNYWFDVNVGYIGTLLLNGLGFKCTKKLFRDTLRKRWRFNVGHSQVFLYFPPKTLLMKVKQRFIHIHGLLKNQIFDTLKLLKVFRRPDCYKGIGLKYPDEYIPLKKGKVRQ